MFNTSLLLFPSMKFSASFSITTSLLPAVSFALSLKQSMPHIHTTKQTTRNTAVALFLFHFTRLFNNTLLTLWNMVLAIPILLEISLSHFPSLVTKLPNYLEHLHPRVSAHGKYSCSTGLFISYSTVGFPGNNSLRQTEQLFLGETCACAAALIARFSPRFRDIANYCRRINCNIFSRRNKKITYKAKSLT